MTTRRARPADACGETIEMVERIGSGEGRAGTGLAPATPTGLGEMSGGGGGVRGASDTEDPSASEAPQNRQNCELGSEPPRQRAHSRSIASGALAPTSMTREGGIGGATVPAGASRAGGGTGAGCTSPGGGRLGAFGGAAGAPLGAATR
jgi:hypothetical protein